MVQAAQTIAEDEPRQRHPNVESDQKDQVKVNEGKKMILPTRVLLSAELFGTETAMAFEQLYTVPVSKCAHTHTYTHTDTHTHARTHAHTHARAHTHTHLHTHTLTHTHTLHYHSRTREKDRQTQAGRENLTSTTGACNTDLKMVSACTGKQNIEGQDTTTGVHRSV